MIHEYTDARVETETLDLRHFGIAALRRLLAIVRREAIQIIHWNFYEPIKNPYFWALTLLIPGVKHYYTDHISRPAGGSSSSADSDVS